MEQKKQNNNKELKEFFGLPEVMIGSEETMNIMGIHLLKPTQEQLDQGKEMALDKNLDKIFIYNCISTYTGVKGKNYTDDQVNLELNKDIESNLQ